MLQKTKRTVYYSINSKKRRELYYKKNKNKKEKVTYIPQKQQDTTGMNLTCPVYF